MGAFVLVPGAWHGGWCYGRVANLLRAAGHDAYTPTLTGLGERGHLAGMPISLRTHVADIIGVIEYEDLSDVVLCGHSYAGMVITGVAAALGDRIRSLVYLDGRVPDDGVALLDLISAGQREYVLTAAKTGGVIGPLPAAAFGLTGDDASWVDSKCTPQPVLTFVESVRLTGREKEVPNHTYVRAIRYEDAGLTALYERFSKDPLWKAVTIDSGHEMMIENPKELSKVLLGELVR
ncbi:alpha/beta hydrolase family protein [Kribbella ginsengisoli]|uniref:Alpha/beta fold hydrolase n=1 Tax=Kribbella ginsengisoli TaxID=363865 RepID=A0ABP6Z7K4_9ACTN